MFLGMLFILTGTVYANEIDNNILIEKSSLTKYESSAREASVRVVTQGGMGSGIYVTINKKNVVLTAAHVVDNFTTVSVIGRNDESVAGSVVYIDIDNDFAIISLPQMTTRNPVKFIQSKSDLKDLIGEDITYTGFPNGHDLFTIRGSIAGIEKGYLVLQSYAWMGASGSGVFNSKGEIVGILVAVDAVRFDRSRHIVESMVWIIPIKNMEMRFVESVLSNLHVK
jgi:S1-C subfamily serine protease